MAMLALQAGEWGTEAEMDAVPEGEVAGTRPPDVERFGILVDLLVAIGRRQADDHLGPCGNRHTAQLDRLDGVSERRVRDRRVEAQELLQGRRQTFRMVTQRRQLRRIAEQGDDAVADEAGGRVMTGDDQLEDRREQLPRIEALVAVTGDDQGTHEVVPRCPCLDVDELLEQGDDGVGGLLGPGVLLGSRSRDEQPGEALSQCVTVGLGHTEQLADDRERQWKREAGNEINRLVAAVSGDVVEQIVDDRLNAWPQSLDAAWRERPRDQPAEPAVVRGIDREHVSGEGRSGEALGHRCRVGEQGGLHVLRQAGVVERGAGLLVVDHEPRLVAIDERHLVHRPAPAHVGEEAERVVAVVGPPRRQCCRHVLLTHRQTISQLRHAPRRVIPRRSGRPSVQFPMWAAYGPEIPSVGRPELENRHGGHPDETRLTLGDGRVCRAEEPSPAARCGGGHRIGPRPSVDAAADRAERCRLG